jgi:tellurite resistance-related uncharacterized protein
MIITKLTGRLANQMFQYAIGRALSLKNGIDESEFKLDLYSFLEPPFWPYTLNRFRAVVNAAKKDEIKRFQKYHWKKGKFWFWYNRTIANRRRYADERQFHFEPWIMTLKDPVYLDGNWQSEKYFIEYEDIIRKDFTLRAPLSDQSKKLEEQILKVEAVSLHVRRDEMVSNKRINDWHGVCSVEYYNDAIKVMAGKVKNPHFFCFSDDPVWTKENIHPPYPVTYMPYNSEHPEEDLILMSRCKHHIIANSTFSWWGAWLNPSKNKTVIAPKKWFNTSKMNTNDIIPESWIKL